MFNETLLEQEPGITVESIEKILTPKMRNMVLFLAGCIALMMSGYGLIMPIMAKRLEELGAGSNAQQILGLLTLAFSVTQFIFSPLMGRWADIWGRKPLILIALGGLTVANLVFLISPNPWFFLIARLLEGAVTAGLLPAAMGIVADVVPETQRARWTGIVMGGYSAGFVLGPMLGGILFDLWGYIAPFGISALCAFGATMMAWVMIKETLPGEARKQAIQNSQQKKQRNRGERRGLGDAIQGAWATFIALLVIDFVSVFAFAFIEPPLMFYVYNQLFFTPTELGIVLGGYGLASLLGQAVLGSLSDRWGRKPIVLIGLPLFCSLYFGLMLFSNFWLVLLVMVTAGIGSALTAPALSAMYMDITKAENRSLVMGLRGSMLSLGGIAGPLIISLVGGLVSPVTTFAIAGVVVLVTIFIALMMMKEKKKSQKSYAQG